MLAVLALSFGLAALDPAPPPRPTSRPEPPMTEAQRLEDEAYRVSEGERRGDSARPDRIICDLRRVPGSNRRVRHCSTVADRAAARREAQSVLSYGPGGTSAN